MNNLIPATREAFHAQLRDIERAHNAGATTRYNEQTSTTEWIVAGNVVGTSTGLVGEGRGYAIDYFGEGFGPEQEKNMGEGYAIYRCCLKCGGFARVGALSAHVKWCARRNG